MSDNARITRSFRTASAGIYVTDIIASWVFAASPYSYMHGLVAFYTSLMCLTMLFVSLKGPDRVMQKLDTPAFAFLFTFRGRYMVDVFIGLFLFGMGAFGIVMAVFTLILIFGIRFVGVQHPEAFSELFRKPVTGEGEDDETFVTYDGATLESSDP